MKIKHVPNVGRLHFVFCQHFKSGEQQTDVEINVTAKVTILRFMAPH